MISPDTSFYSKAEFETISCNLCEGTDLKVIAEKDQNGLKASTCLCLRCGLMFINPRMKPDWYGKYYEDEYRKQRSIHKGGFKENENDSGVFEKRIKFGEVFAEFIKPHIKSGLTIDVGSSTGGVLLGFKKVIPELKLLGIEPSPEEANYANNKGVETITSMFETLQQELPAASNILSTRNLNHLLDPKKFLIWAYNQLEPDGRLIIAVINFRNSVYKRGSIERAAQMDHVYMYTPETLRTFLESAGFDIIFFNDNEKSSFRESLTLKRRGLTPSHMRVVAKKSNRKPFEKLMIPAGQGKHILTSMRPFKIRFHYIQHRIRKVIHRIMVMRPLL